MSIRFNCPDCGQPMQVPDSLAGKQGKCPGCARVLHVPAAGGAPPPVQAAPESPELKDCPYCGETIKGAARKCRFCGEFLDHQGRAASPGAVQRRQRRPPSDPGSYALGFMAGFFGGCIGLILVHCLAQGQQTKSGATMGFIVAFVVGCGLNVLVAGLR